MSSNKKKSILIVKETCWNAKVTCCECPRKTIFYIRETKKDALSHFDNDGKPVIVNGWYINAKTGKVLCPICTPQAIETHGRN